MVSEKMLDLGTTRSCIRELFEYGIRRAAEIGKENVYDYSLGNPSIPAPEGVNEAMISILKEMDSLKVHSYTPATGNIDVRKAIAADLTGRFGMEIKGENLFLTCGAAPALLAAASALAVEKAQIMVIAPFFPEYRPIVESAGAELVVVPADTKGFQIQLAELESRLTEHTQAVIINSPNNPSGVIYTEETLKELAGILNKKAAEYGHPIYLIADEPYRELAYDGTKVPFVPAIYKDTIVCYSYSKSLSLPGERIGYVCVPDQVTDSKMVYAAVAGAARAHGHVCAPSLQQYAIARCTSLRPDLEAYDQNRCTLYEALSSYGYECTKPNGAFYMFVKAPNGNSQAFSDMAKEKNLLIVPGDDFGCPEFFRISTCVAHDMILRSLPVFKELIDQVKA